MKKMINLKSFSACRTFHKSDKDTSSTIWTLTIPATELPEGLPFGPNARNADLSAAPAKAMLKTLRQEPENFIFYNNGIMLVVDSLKAKRTGELYDVQIAYNEPDEDEDFIGHGLLNGGHTYKSLIHALYGKHKRGETYPNIDKASVQLTVAVGIEEDSVADISRARNLSKSVPDYALRTLKKDWELIESYLPNEYRKNIVFKPNEFIDEGEGEPKYTVVDLVARLALFNNKLFDFQQDIHPLKAYTSKGALANTWEDNDYQEIIPLLPDFLRLEEWVMEGHLKANGFVTKGKEIIISKVNGCSTKESTLITGKKIKLTVALPFVMPILAAFRIFIRDGKWVKPVDQLWEEYGDELIKRLWETYRQEGRNSSGVFGRSKSTWSGLTNFLAMKFVNISG